MRHVLIFSFFISLFFLRCGDAGKPKTEQAVIDSTDIIFAKIGGKKKAERLDTLFGNMHKNGRFNGAVLVAQEGVVIYHKAFGYADYAHKDSLTLNTSFQLASVSKQFTAAAIMLLKQQGKLTYDDSLRKFFPSIPYYGITVKHLLTHRSGLPNYLYFLDEDYRKRDVHPKVVTNQDVIDGLINLRPDAYAKPGIKYDYSNTGYALLASIVEKVSGKPFAVFMKENFFTPLKMNHTYIFTDTSAHDKKPLAYYGSWKVWDTNCFDYVVGDKGVFSTADDMFLWSKALFSGSPLTKATLQEAFTPASPEKKGKSNYGYGWRTRDLTGKGKAVFHNGWWHGFTTAFFRRLDDRTTIIILCNKVNRGIYNMRPVMNILGGNTIPLFDEDDENGATDTVKE